MLNHAQLAARLLRDAAEFFRHLAKENPSLQEAMVDNAKIYDQVAQLVESSPLDVLELDEKPAQ